MLRQLLSHFELLLHLWKVVVCDIELNVERLVTLYCEMILGELEE